MDFRPVRTPISGVARYCIDLAEAMQANNDGVDVSLYAQNYKQRNEELNSINERFTNVLASNIPRKVENLLLESGVNPFFIQKEKYDIVHETYFARLDVKGAKKVSTIHDIIPYTHPELFSRSTVFLSNKNLMRQLKTSEIIISPSKYTANQINTHFPGYENKIRVIPLGVSFSMLDAISKADDANGLLEESAYFVMVGNVETRKNIITAAKALASLNKRLTSNVKLIVVGRDNGSGAFIISECNKILGNNVIFTGFVSETDKALYIKKSLGLLFPSIHEGFGIPAIEGMMCGVPVLLADNSSLSELALSNWQLFETYDHDSLSAKLEDIVNGDVPKDLIKESFEFASECNWASAAQKTIQEYKSLL